MVAAAQKEVLPVVERAPTSKKFIDMTGRKFGRLTVKKFIGFGGKLAKWTCDCECGGEIQVFGNHLRFGKVQHCGCLSPYDGRSAHPLYQTWKGMIDRCENTQSPGYVNYGGRGIVVCERWLQSFNDFAADVGERPSADHSLGRIDNDGNYEPSNVRWETDFEQGSNKRSCRYVTVNGETKSMAEWARGLGITTEAFRLRLKKLASLEAIVSTPKGEVVVCEPKNVRECLEDDAPPKWPSEIPLNTIHHLLAESHSEGLQLVEVLRRISGAWGYVFRSRVLDNHVLFCFRTSTPTPTR